MQRRSTLAALAALPSLITTSLASAASQPLLQALKPSPRMPVLFVGHGSPMNAIEDNAWRRSWQAMGTELLARGVRPQLILCVSAHWLTPGWQFTGMASPKTIHDFGGFPQALMDQQYPAPGAPAVARSLASALKSPATGAALGVDTQQWGFDHGTWSVLKPMFPKADIPVLQLSMDYSRAPTEHYALGRQLQALRERGVLIVGSGNIVHNLRATRDGTAANEAYDWATEFDAVVQNQIKKGQLDALQNFQSLGAVAQQAHPSHDHYLPLLYAAGAARSSEMPRFFNTGFQSASISMRSVLWG
ncbi:4,5-DOPA dioxygenase extradiol [Rhodoferax saidenbachensis]|uniref:4,5-DOPA dioxygenase extradiol n=1 Tax=Rhodoferax saidenbachensis TaxID=1484693 RepID=A0ABU1ZMF5_9BURK|nr:4,5-DOPA dioxygenase extradiol [Rhodoferax saidenbachensis]MDR7305746.1 4,5-DOPA dioxygenase extradiol [Rhodoferax saidenbachensis]